MDKQEALRQLKEILIKAGFEEKDADAIVARVKRNTPG